MAKTQQSHRTACELPDPEECTKLIRSYVRGEAYVECGKRVFND